ncbi:EamA family transporter [Halobacteriales archaeon SW_7_65_23]|nr:MAG: EamA family transporter [Halobacteriales archaeon SW_7_65_23]
MASQRHTTAGLFVSLSAVWGLSFVAARAAVVDVPPLWLAALRFDLAGVLLLGFAVLTAERWLPTGRAEWSVVAIGGTLFIAVHHALLFAGQQYVTSAVAGVVISLDPILAAGFACALLPDEGLSPVGGLGLLLGLCGVAVVANPDPASLTGPETVGVALVLCSAAAFALGAVLTRRYRTELPVASLQAWMMLFGAVLLHLMLAVAPVGGVGTITWSEGALAGLVYLTVVASGLGYLLYFELLDRVGPVEVNLVAYVVPLFAALGGWVFLGEQVTLSTVAGFVLIAAGFGLLKRSALREEVRSLRTVFG